MKYQELLEKLKIVKMSLPNKSTKFSLIWNDKASSHELFDRIKTRTGLTRKQAISTIVTGVDLSAEHMVTDGPWVIRFTKSEFMVIVFKEKDKVTIKTVLAGKMKVRPNDRPIDIKEAEELFDINLSEFYEDGFYNGMVGNLLIEESIDSKALEVFVEYINIEL